MRRYAILGGGLALVAAAAAFFNASLGLQSLWVLLVGAALVLLPVRSLAARIAGFVLGAVMAWGAFALRAAVLPDIPAGRALVAAIPILLIVGVAAITRGRLPVWAGLLGLTTFYGAYEAVFAASPTDFIEQSIATMTSVLLLMSVGALTAFVLAPRVIADELVLPEQAPERAPAGDGSTAKPVSPAPVTIDLDELRPAGTVS